MIDFALHLETVKAPKAPHLRVSHRRPVHFLNMELRQGQNEIHDNVENNCPVWLEGLIPLEQRNKVWFSGALHPRRLTEKAHQEWLQKETEGGESEVDADKEWFSWEQRIVLKVFSSAGEENNKKVVQTQEGPDAVDKVEGKVLKRMMITIRSGFNFHCRLTL